MSGSTAKRMQMYKRETATVEAVKAEKLKLEKKMRISNISEYIKERVTMPEVILRYHHLGRHRGRTSCPIHGGTNDNLGYDDRVFHCFVCGAKGDVISFVMQLNNCDFKTAVRILDSDFRLGIESMTEEEKEEAAKREYERRIALERERARVSLNNEAFRTFTKYKHELKARDDVDSNPLVSCHISWCDRQLDFIMDGGDYKDDPSVAIASARQAVEEYSKREAFSDG